MWSSLKCSRFVLWRILVRIWHVCALCVEKSFSFIVSVVIDVILFYIAVHISVWWDAMYSKYIVSHWVINSDDKNIIFFISVRNEIN